jgi:large subunit ribosomal protein L21
MYAIIEDSGTQIRVSEGEVIKVALRELPPDVATITFDKVLLVGDAPKADGKAAPAPAPGSAAPATAPVAAKIGAPYVDGAKVTGDVLAQEKTDRIMAWRYRRRKNVLRRKGHRQSYLKVKITAIQA